MSLNIEFNNRYAITKHDWRLNGSDVLVQDYVYGSLYIDEVILQRTGATDYSFTHDFRYSVTNLTNTVGSIVESYDFIYHGRSNCY